MTEMEKTNIKKFIDDMILLFYGRYVDDTLVVIKEEHLKLVHDALNNFNKGNTLITVISHDTTKQLGFLSLYTDLSIFVIK